jgi:copper chaperone CopZ
MSPDTINTYIVEGMSCGHCEAAVREEIETVEGVEAVDVDLSAKQVVVRGDFRDVDVRAAIDEAGYEAAA